MAKKSLTRERIYVDFEKDGKRRERHSRDIAPEELASLHRDITERFLKPLGYERNA